MAIILKLNDATIEIGGTFADALAFVKSIPGRRYDGQSKMWSAPTTLNALFVPLPYDITGHAKPQRSGEHVTKWGTRYSREEWSAKQAVNNIRIPEEIARRCAERHDAAWQSFVAIIGDERKAGQIKALYLRFGGDLDEAEEFGKIVFSSPARRQEISAAVEAYLDAAYRADDEAEGYREAEERRIYDGTELY